MITAKKWSNWVVGTGIVMIGFAFPHLIDDFLFDIPAEFGLTNLRAQVLAGIFSIQLFLIFAAAARGVRWAYGFTCFWGVFLALACILKHLPRMLQPESYWSGAFSETLIWGLLVSSLALATVSVLALWKTRNRKVIERNSP
jgi:hypothetical protein